jgi:glycosyltransferase involved in cell wall biosynthesis
VGEFIEAARLLAQRGINTRFVLAGDADADNPAAIPDAQLQAWQDEGIITWQGWCNDMPELLRSANIFCLPSYREGLSKILAEAAACGRAIVTTDVPGCRDVVQDGVNGLLVQPRDTHGLAEAITTLLSDASLRKKMGAEGRRIAEERFSTHQIAAQTLAVYQRAGMKGISA